MKKTVLSIIALTTVICSTNVVFAQDEQTVSDSNQITVEAALQNETEGTDNSESIDDSENIDDSVVAEVPVLTDTNDIPDEGNGEPEETLTGWVKKEDGVYYYNTDGTLYTGWLNDKSADRAGKYYFDPETGKMVTYKSMQIDGKLYLFDENGRICVGWKKMYDKWYYTNNSGVVQTGWHKINNKQYYFDPSDSEYKGAMLAGTQRVIGGKKYTFDLDGKIVTSGWCNTGKGFWYVEKSGELCRGWKKWNNKWYYMDPKNGCYMAHSEWCTYGGQKYYFAGSGDMITGWKNIEGKWYYFSNDGAMCKGWKYIGKKWYYLQYKDGVMLGKGWHEIASKRYYMNGGGDMATGWKNVDGKWYYLSNNGDMKDGWQKVSGKWYYLEKNTGIMLRGWKEIGGKLYYLNGSGVMVTKWQNLNGNWFYFSTDGAMREGWQKIDGCWYYFYHKNDKNGGTYGAMARNTTIDGYKINANGVYSEVYKYTKPILDSVGWNLQAAFNWSVHSLSYSYTPASASAGSEWFATYGYKNRTGDCYVFAATFCHLARTLGYEAYFVQGYVPQLGGGSVTHGWVEVVVNGAVYVCDPDFTYETGRNGYMINYGNSGTWRYSNYRRAD